MVLSRGIMAMMLMLALMAWSASAEVLLAPCPTGPMGVSQQYLGFSAPLPNLLIFCPHVRHPRCLLERGYPLDPVLLGKMETEQSGTNSAGMPANAADVACRCYNICQIRLESLRLKVELPPHFSYVLLSPCMSPETHEASRFVIGAEAGLWIFGY